MSLPTVIVDIGFSSPSTGTYLHLDDESRGLLDTATLAPDELFVDVSQWAASVTIVRGARRADDPTLRYEAGTATIVLRNEDRRFDPTNLSGPYVAGGVTQVEPMRAVRIRATWDGVTYPLWRGFTDNWQVNYDSPNTSPVVLTCTDGYKVFQSYDRDASGAVGSGETSGARIGRILNAITWPAADRVVATGDVTVQSTTLADNVLTELLLTGDSELGEFYMDSRGRATFRNRLASLGALRSVFANALFGDQPVEGVDTTVNLTRNPSVETDTIGWSGIGSVPPTVARSNTRAQVGTWSLLATWGTGGVLPAVNYDITGLVVGTTYTLSVYVWVPTGSPDVAVIVAGTNTFGDATTLKDQWVRLTWTGVASATTWGFQIWPLTSPTSGQTVYLDGLQAEVGATVTAYCDGDQTHCEWDGAAHNSTSRRLPELPYADVQLSYDDQSIYNLFSIARAGGSVQAVEHAGSRTAYLTRTHQRHDLILQTDPEALLYGEVLRSQFSSPELRFSALDVKPRRDPECLFPQVLGREFGDRIRIIRRPPGGGSPIERDVFIRGIEHQFSKDLDWSTRWVLQAAPTITSIGDQFTRTVSNGWGNADTGQAWVVGGAGGASDLSVGSGVGSIAVPTTGGDRIVTVDTGQQDHECVVVLETNTVPVGGIIRYGLVARYTDSSNHYRGIVQVTTGDVVTAEIASRVTGTLTTIGSAGTALTIGTNIVVRFKVAGSRIRLKVWNTSGSEPAGWTVDVTNTALLTGNRCGCFARREAGNTSPTSMDFDLFTATNLPVWI